ncbi:LuxR C-terminal-related transcriptional regulator [Pleurocapsa sp. PCC 7319]|uniref:LuxR C-terminal-related transcriptional regulator n=1 Tax=Pleurocapsa sp. PCC 7319 TaxID=118161 RepID=UPI003529AB80
MRAGLKQLLSSQPQKSIVGMAEDGYRGVEAALSLKPNLAIIDVGMPHLDGIAATQQIKAALPDIKVVMLTSHTAETEIIASLSSGADAYCVKGVSLEKLLTAIATVEEGATYLDAQIAQKIVNHLQTNPAKKRNHHLGEQLSKRELEVLELIVEGCSNPEIGKRLNLSPNTIKSYVRSIMNKLMVSDRVQAAVIALRNGLVQ